MLVWRKYMDPQCTYGQGDVCYSTVKKKLKPGRNDRKWHGRTIFKRGKYPQIQTFLTLHTSASDEHQKGVNVLMSPSLLVTLTIDF